MRKFIDFISSIKIGRQSYRQFVAFCIIAMMFIALIGSMFWTIEDNRMVDATLMAFSALVGYYFGSSDKHDNDEIK